MSLSKMSLSAVFLMSLCAVAHAQSDDQNQPEDHYRIGKNGDSYADRAYPNSIPSKLNDDLAGLANWAGSFQMYHLSVKDDETQYLDELYIGASTVLFFTGMEGPNVVFYKLRIVDKDNESSLKAIKSLIPKDQSKTYDLSTDRAVLGQILGGISKAQLHQAEIVRITGSEGGQYDTILRTHYSRSN